MKYSIGIDVGGTTTKFGIVDDNGLIVNQGVIKTSNHLSVHTFIDELFDGTIPLKDKFVY